MAVTVTTGVPVKPRKIGGRTTINSKGEIVKQVGAEDDLRVRDRSRQEKPYKTVRITGADQKNTKEILKEHFPKTRENALENVAKQDTEQREGEWVRYNNEVKLRLSQIDAARAIGHMKRTLPRGAPATKPTFMLGAHIVTMPDGSKALVRD